MFEVIKMPANYDMLVSHSPPVFSHSPPTGFLSEYNSGYSRIYDPLRGFCRPQVIPTTIQNRKSYGIQIIMPASPKRSCLVHRNDDNSTPTTPESPTEEINHSNSRTKKKVVFADDQGLALTEVRVMSEPSNVPPLWSLQFLAHITQGLISPIPNDQWTVDFKQPASDYLDFRLRLEKEMVSLENVIVRENECVVVGTVKVKNLSFQKEVIVRATWDNWKSQEDIFCPYTQFIQIGKSCVHILYDTFSFRITLPPSSSSKLEFCVCYRCDDKEYWDNNHGTNYTISKRTNVPDDEEHNNNILPIKEKGNHPSSPMSIKKYSDVTQAKVSPWSEFASWNHLENNCPYW